MFPKMKAVLTATAVAGVLAMAGASSASAVTVTNGGAFNGNAGPSRLTVTNGGTVIPLNCTASSGGGTVTAGTYTVFPATIGTITPVFSNCTGPSGLVFTVSCTTVAPNQTMLNLTGNTSAPGTTPGSITGIDCVITFAALGCSAHVTGSVQGSYTNPVAGPPAVNGKLTVFAAGQHLSVSGSTCPASILPNGTDIANFGGPGSGTTGITNLTYTLTTTGPTVDDV